jgi:hypothetical protein
MQALRKIRRCFVVDRHLSIVPFSVFYTLGKRDRSVCCSIQREGFVVEDLFHRGSTVMLKKYSLKILMCQQRNMGDPNLQSTPAYRICFGRVAMSFMGQADTCFESG